MKHNILLLAFLLPTGLFAQKITLQQPEWHANNIEFSGFSPDGKYVMTGDLSRIILTDVRSGKTARTIMPPNEASFTSCTFSPDNKLLLIGVNLGNVILWDIAQQKIQWESEIGDEAINTVAFSPNGRYFLIGTGKTLYVFTYPDKKIKFEADLKNEEDYRVKITFSKDCTKVIASKWWNDIQVWDIDTGVQLAQVFPPEKYNIQTYHYDANWYVAYPAGNPDPDNPDITNLNDSEGRPTKHLPVLHSIGEKQVAIPLDSLYSVCEFLFSDNGRYLFTADNRTMTIEQWDLAAAKRIQQVKSKLPVPSLVFYSDLGFTCSHNNRYVAKLNAGERLEIWDMSTGGLVHRIYQPYGALTGPAITFSADDQLLLYSDAYSAILYDVKSGSKIWTTSNENMEPNKMVWQKGGDAIWTTHGLSPSNFRKWDLRKGKLCYVTPSRSTEITNIVFNDDQTQALTTTEDSAQLWSTTNGTLLQSFTPPDSPGGFIYISRGAFSRNGKMIALNTVYNIQSAEDFNTYTIVRVIEIPSGRIVFTYTRDRKNAAFQTFFSPDDKKVVIQYSDGGIIILDARNGNVLQKLNAGEEGLERPVCSPDSRYLASSSVDGHLYLWDIQKGKRLKIFDTSNWRFDFHQFSRDSRYLFWVDTFQHLNVWDIPMNALAYRLSDIEISNVCYDVDKGYIYLSGDKGFQRRNMIDGNLVRQYQNIRMVEHIEPGSGKAVDYNGALMTFYDLETDRQLYSLLPVDSTDYIFSLPTGEYTATKGAVQRTSFYLDGQRFDFEQFDLQTNRPDKVLEAMACPDTALIRACQNAYRKRLKKMGLREETLTAHTPEIQLLTEQLPVVTDATSITVSLRARDSQLPLDRIFVYVNDVPVFGRQGISVRSENSREIEKQIAVPLGFNPTLGGKNKIQVSVMNAGGVESVKQGFYIARSKPAGLPVKYVIVMGADTFAAAPDKTLDFAVKDATDVLQFLGKPEERFASVKTWQLTGAKFTREKIRALKTELLQTRTDDQVYVFVTTHGVLDAQLDYYLATSDMAFDHPAAKGLPFEDLENLLDSIPALNKLLLVDACHAGEIDKETIQRIRQESTQKTPGIRFKTFDPALAPKYVGLENSFELMKELFVDLRRGSGAAVIASAGGMEFAIEGPSWRNSVFTYTLLSGLKEGNADLNKDGAVLVSELQQYLAKTVPELTANQQKPSFRLENIANDWRVW